MTEMEVRPNEAANSASRRGWLLGAGLLAAGLGSGVAWWRNHAMQPPTAAEPIAGFWALQWDTPQGEPVRLQAFRGRPLLINFWATWCPPCIEELPLINSFFNQNKSNGWQVLALAIDRPDAVQGFLQKMHLDFPVALAGANGSDLGRALGNPSGSLPFSVVVGAAGGVLQRKLGRLRQEELNSWAQLK